MSEPTTGWLASGAGVRYITPDLEVIPAISLAEHDRLMAEKDAAYTALVAAAVALVARSFPRSGHQDDCPMCLLRAAVAALEAEPKEPTDA